MKQNFFLKNPFLKKKILYWHLLDLKLLSIVRVVTVVR